MSAEIIPSDADDLFVERKEVDIKQRLKEIVQTSSALVVHNEETFRRMTNLYSESKNWEKQIEFARKQANAPDQDRINLRNDKSKELLVPLKQIQQIAKQKCEQYQSMLEEVKRKERESIQQAVDLLGLEDAPYIPPLEKSIRGEGAIVYTRQVKKFRVTNLSLVPMKYLRIDEDVVELDIKLGVAEIPGIEIYEEKVTQLKSR